MKWCWSYGFPGFQTEFNFNISREHLALSCNFLHYKGRGRRKINSPELPHYSLITNRDMIGVLTLTWLVDRVALKSPDWVLRPQPPMLLHCAPRTTNSEERCICNFLFKKSWPTDRQTDQWTWWFTQGGNNSERKRSQFACPYSILVIIDTFINKFIFQNNMRRREQQHMLSRFDTDKACKAWR